MNPHQVSIPDSNSIDFFKIRARTIGNWEAGTEILGDLETQTTGRERDSPSRLAMDICRDEKCASDKTRSLGQV